MSQPACISTHMMRENASSGPTLRRGVPRISGQGQSWYLMALADCCSILPRGSEDWQYLAGLWKEAMEGMLRYQDQESGLFFQLTALGKTPGNYLETSASAMAAYSIYKGYEMGIFNRQTVQRADLIMMALETEKLKLRNGCSTWREPAQAQAWDRLTGRNGMEVFLIIWEKQLSQMSKRARLPLCCLQPVGGPQKKYTGYGGNRDGKAKRCV